MFDLLVAIFRFLALYHLIILKDHCKCHRYSIVLYMRSLLDILMEENWNNIICLPLALLYLVVMGNIYRTHRYSLEPIHIFELNILDTFYKYLLFHLLLFIYHFCFKSLSVTTSMSIWHHNALNLCHGIITYNTYLHIYLIYRVSLKKCHIGLRLIRGLQVEENYFYHFLI